MHPFEVVSQPVRRRIVEMLASGEHFSGEIEAIVVHEFGVGRSAAQHHLAVLRRLNWVIVREEESLRGYRLNDDALVGLELEVKHLRKLWKRRIGWKDGADPLVSLPSKRGRRGRGMDPDGLWWP